MYLGSSMVTANRFFAWAFFNKYPSELKEEEMSEMKTMLQDFWQVEVVCWCLLSRGAVLLESSPFQSAEAPCIQILRA